MATVFDDERPHSCTVQAPGAVNPADRFGTRGTAPTAVTYPCRARRKATVLRRADGTEALATVELGFLPAGATFPANATVTVSTQGSERFAVLDVAEVADEDGVVRYRRAYLGAGR